MDLSYLVPRTALNQSGRAVRTKPDDEEADSGTGSFNQSAVTLNAWMTTHKGRRIEVATDDLSAVTSIDKIPYTRGLDDNHGAHQVLLQDRFDQQGDLVCLLGLRVRGPAT